MSEQVSAKAEEGRVNQRGVARGRGGGGLPRWTDQERKERGGNDRFGAATAARGRGGDLECGQTSDSMTLTLAWNAISACFLLTCLLCETR